MKTGHSSRFWVNVSAILNHRGRSARSLALEVGVNPATMSRYATGTVPSLEVAARVARAFDLSLDLLVFGTVAKVLKEAGEPVSGRPSPSGDELEERAGMKLATELRLGRLALLADQATVFHDEAVLTQLTRHHPVGLTQEALGLLLSQAGQKLDATQLTSSLFTLVGAGLVEERRGNPRRYRAVEANPELRKRDVRDYARVILEAVNILILEVFPTLQRRPSNVLFTMKRLNMRRERARALGPQTRQALEEMHHIYDAGEEGEPGVMLQCIALPVKAE